MNPQPTRAPISPSYLPNWFLDETSVYMDLASTHHEFSTQKNHLRRLGVYKTQAASTTAIVLIVSLIPWSYQWVFIYSTLCVGVIFSILFFKHAISKKNVKRLSSTFEKLVAELIQNGKINLKLLAIERQHALFKSQNPDNATPASYTPTAPWASLGWAVWKTAVLTMTPKSTDSDSIQQEVPLVPQAPTPSSASVKY